MRMRKAMVREKIKSDLELAAFLITVPNKKRKTWQWKLHEIYTAGGEMAHHGIFKLIKTGWAQHWKVDNIYVIDRELYDLNLAELAMEAFGYSIVETEDGGYWLSYGIHQIKYYRKRGWAKKRAIKLILEEIGR